MRTWIDGSKWWLSVHQSMVAMALAGLVGCGDMSAESTSNNMAATSHGGTGTGSGTGADSAPQSNGSPKYSADVMSGAAGDASASHADIGPTNQGDKFKPVGTNPFTLTAADPLSTFGADVDTASYDLFRRDIGMGQLPQPDSVRLEEWVNAFKYADPAPAKEDVHPFKIALEAAPNPVRPGTSLLRIGIKGRPIDDQKKPTNLVFLVDVSGSMGATNKLPLVKVVLNETLEILDPTDTVSIVTYAGTTAVKLAPTQAKDKATISGVVNSLQSGGSTAGASGITLAYEQAHKAYLEGGFNHVLLCTDGDFNVGISNTSELVKLIEEKRKTGITLTALGFGNGNLNDAMMEQVSNKGNGVYSVITDADHAIKYVHERMLSNVVYIAKDMKIQVEFNPKTVKAYRLLGYEDRAIADQDFKNDLVDAGEVGAGLQVTALYELVLTGAELPAVEGAPSAKTGPDWGGTATVAATDLARVAIRYKQPGAAETDAATETALAVPASALLATFEAASTDTQWATAIAAIAEIFKGSPYAVPSALPSLYATVKANLGSDPDRQELQVLLEKAAKLLGVTL